MFLFALGILINRWKSADQSIPSHPKEKASSNAFEFTFDYNLQLFREDSEETAFN